jgi:PPOX class probable F420-dependent enzyme
VKLPRSARALIESGRLAHLVTLNREGSPQISCVWVGLDGDELVSDHLGDRLKLRNVRRDPRVSLSIEGDEIQPPGLLQYLIVHGRARITEGGAPELLQELAYRYLGPGVRFPPMDDPPGVLAAELDDLRASAPSTGALVDCARKEQSEARRGAFLHRLAPTKIGPIAFGLAGARADRQGPPR